ncbi:MULTISPECIES: cupin domain-containing protein [Acidovorax]|uniref:cupin domain-containing protein n=1 Tax=Acidovorax TaxID=12916 RepID=UPI002587C218|nr:MULTISPECIES: cupin domain-containing protein [Acidovorax]MCM2347705.1 cupin domain-containing protein [Acidovorax soli]
MRPQALSTIQVDDERVIVTEWRFPPGAETGWHTHAHNYVVVPMTDGSLVLETDEGIKSTQLIKGSAYARQVGVRHNVINPGPGEVIFVEVETR